MTVADVFAWCPDTKWVTDVLTCVIDWRRRRTRACAGVGRKAGAASSLHIRYALLSAPRRPPSSPPFLHRSVYIVMHAQKLSSLQQSQPAATVSAGLPAAGLLCPYDITPLVSSQQ